MRHKKGSLVLKVLVFVFAIYSIGTLINLQFEINYKKQQINELQAKIEEQTMRNEQLSDMVTGTIDDSYIESIARDKLGLAYPNERMFINPQENRQSVR